MPQKRTSSKARSHKELVSILERLNRKLLEDLGEQARLRKSRKRCPAEHNRFLLDREHD